MRRMPTTKQLELLEYLSKGIKINNLPEILKLPFPYNDIEETKDMVEYYISEGYVDFETHTMSGTGAVNYYETEEYENYISLTNDESIEFPETIDTIEKLAQWLQVNLPLLDDSYIEDASATVPPYYDGGDYEYSYENGVVSWVLYRDSDAPILQIGSQDEPLMDIYSNQFIGLHVGPVQTTNIVRGDNSSTPIYVNSNLNITRNGGYMLAPYFYGQLGASDYKRPAYVTNLNAADNLKIWYDDGEEKDTIYEQNELVIMAQSDIDIDSQAVLTLGSRGNNSKTNVRADGGELHLFGNTGVIIEPSSSSKKIIVKNLPTSDPGVEGALWDDSGVLKISHPAP